MLETVSWFWFSWLPRRSEARSSLRGLKVEEGSAPAVGVKMAGFVSCRAGPDQSQIQQNITTEEEPGRGILPPALMPPRFLLSSTAEAQAAGKNGLEITPRQVQRLEIVFFQVAV